MAGETARDRTADRGSRAPIPLADLIAERATDHRADHGAQRGIAVVALNVYLPDVLHHTAIVIAARRRRWWRRRTVSVAVVRTAAVANGTRRIRFATGQEQREQCANQHHAAVSFPKFPKSLHDMSP